MSCVCRVRLDAATDLAGQVVNRGGDVASNQIPLDLTEPQLELIEPRRVGRGEVEVNPTLLLKELVNQTSFVDGEVVECPACFVPVNERHTGTRRARWHEVNGISRSRWPFTSYFAPGSPCCHTLHRSELRGQCATLTSHWYKTSGNPVVEDDLLPGRALSDNLFDEINDVLSCVASCGLAVHAASGCLQSGAQR
jgi:hypothetical protein